MPFAPRRTAGLRSRLLRDTAFAVVLAAVFHAAVMLWIFRSGSETLVHDGLRGQAEDLVDALRFAPDGTVNVDMHEPMRWGYDAFTANLRYRVLDAQGRVLAASPDGREPLRAGPSDPVAEGFTAIETPDGTMRVATLRIASPIGPLYVQTGRSDRFFELTAEAIVPVVLETSLAIGLTAIVMIGIVIVVGVGRALRPVQAASRQAAAIEPGNLEARIDVRGMPREILPLVEAFNGSLARIEAGFTVQQRFFANAAHELKTPLSVLRAHLELRLPPGAHADLFAEIDYMARTVNQLLQLAEAGSAASYRFEPLRLAVIVQEAATLCANLAASRDVALACETEDEAVAIHGDRAAVLTALRNLIENAVRHTPPGGTVRLRAQGSTLAVEDDGPGFAEDTRDRVFERFWKADPGSEGSGLGLAIVAEIAAAHGAEVRAENRPHGGARVAMVFGEHVAPARSRTLRDGRRAA